MRIETRSRITCPLCGAHQEEDMPLDACQWYWECPHCQGLVRPKPGDCCVFCSYGTVPCPPKQMVGNLKVVAV